MQQPKKCKNKLFNNARAEKNKGHMCTVIYNH